jgi:ATP-dependent Lhr-like helicase
LRREIEPVTTAQYYAFLNRWQHIASGTQLHGVDGTLQVIRQLQGAEFAAAAWETIVLPRRVAHYDPEYLDALCLSGEVSWGRLSPHPAFERAPDMENGGGRRVRPTRVAPLAIFLREDADWLLAVPPLLPEDSLSRPARQVFDVLQARGACFVADLTRATGRPSTEVEDALWELVTAGRVTADGFENLRALLDPKRRATRPRHAAGRWALLKRAAPATERNAESFARQLLRRWGVVFRDAAVREPLAPPWRELLVALRRMESRGEVRGGRFVAAFLGEQFALPEALDLLRSIRRTGETATESDVFTAPGPAPALAAAPAP